MKNEHEDRLLSVAEARQRILYHFSVLPGESVPLLNALNRVLAQDIASTENIPPFANSSMDGYAVRATDVVRATPDMPVSLRVVADIAAGRPSPVEIEPGAAARIMTGAPLPKGADAIVPVEMTDEWHGPGGAGQPAPEMVQIRQNVQPGAYVRWPGEDIRAGDEVLRAGTAIRPAEIAVLASVGWQQVPVIRRPRLAVLASGDELVEPGQALGPGQIRNSNSYALAAAARSAGAEPLWLGIARDEIDQVLERLQQAVAAGADAIVSSAGVSVGAHDVVRQALESYGRLELWRINMRPGKPLAFGHFREVPFLGLPGNPVSALVTFELFARPAILKMSGRTLLERPRVRCRVLEALRSDGRESYLRARVSRDEEGYIATSAGGQGSNMLSSLARANALLVVPAGVRELPAGAEAEAMMIDWPEERV